MSIRAFLSLLLLSISSTASAMPLTIAGFGDSITCTTCNDGSYLSLLGSYLDDVPILDDNGISADISDNVAARLDTWLTGGGTADVVIILTGTPDVFQRVGGFHNVDYSEAATVANIQAMIGQVIGAGIDVILAAPPVGQSPCDFVSASLCSEVMQDLADLSDALGTLASSLMVPFVDLHAIFAAHPDIGEVPGSPDSLLRSDGIHPAYATGDELIAQSIAGVINSAIVPEPTTGALLALGLVAMTAVRRRR